MARVLIVDDEPMIALLLADWLNELGHAVVGPARNVTSALALIGSAAPDAAIVDVTLGKETGYPIAMRLKELKSPSFSRQAAPRAACRLLSKERPALAKPFHFAATQAARRRRSALCSGAEIVEGNLLDLRLMAAMQFDIAGHPGDQPVIRMLVTYG